MDLKAFFSREELLAMGFEKVGDPVWVSRKASFYAIRGSLGHHVRIDDFCVIKGHVVIGSYIHIASYCSLSGVGGKVEVGDCVGMGNRTTLYTASNDFRADAMGSNAVPQDLVKIITGDVTIGRAALIGAHCLLLPGVHVGDAASIGAQCLVSQSIEPGSILVSVSSRTVQAGNRDVGKILALADKLAAADMGKKG
jgi:acetyltransferase-like isoleucine patch superfamily enzyme